MFPRACAVKATELGERYRRGAGDVVDPSDARRSALVIARHVVLVDDLQSSIESPAALESRRAGAVV